MARQNPRKMKYLFTKTKFKFLILFSLTLVISCESDPDLTDFETSKNAPYQIPPYKQVYSDAILEQVLIEELGLINNNLKKNASKTSDAGMTIDKTNPKKVYVHYMPWFQSKPHDGYWGQHWTMTNKNPDILDENGINEIASYYNPLIGPYSSSDPDLHEYHFLLMKLAGFTYGPLIGLFFFGIIMKRNLIDNLVPVISLLVPVIIGFLWYFSTGAPGVPKGELGIFGAYKFGFEIIIYNAILSFILLLIISKKNPQLT